MKHTGFGKIKAEVKTAFSHIEKAYKRAASLARKGECKGAAEWLYDNFYIIIGEYRATQKRLFDSDRLPGSSGEPRIYAYVRRQAFSKRILTVPLLSQNLKILCDEASPNTSELYSYPTLFIAALLSLLGKCCESMLAENDDDSFCSKREYTEALEYCVSSFRFLSGVDVSRLCDMASPVENTLALDPAGCYGAVKASCRSEYRKRVSKAAQKEGMDENEYAKKIVRLAEKGRTVKERHVGYYLFPEKKKLAGTLYFVTVQLFALLFSVSLYPFCSFWCLLTLPASYELGRRFADFLSSKLCVPTPLLSLELTGIPDSMRTLTVITALLSGDDPELFDRLESFSLANRDKNAFFGILADLPESRDADSPNDASVLEYAKGRIEALNIKYGGGFCLITRRRSYSQSEKTYMGWERKRGAVLELCRLLKDEESEDASFFGDYRCTENIRYVITLDADTLLSVGDVARLVGYMAHPNNLPVMNEEKSAVISGYGIMQPKMETSLFSAKDTVFSGMIGGNGGVDLYTGASFDSYQELFGEGIFCGKGIFDVDTFYTVLKDAFPENIVLSHDILEGSRLRTALLCDMTLYDSVPKTPLAYFKRAHRWIRGDVQALLFCGRYVKNGKGDRVKNPISRLSSYKIADNVRRDLLPPFSVLCVIISAFLKGSSGAFLLVGSLSYLILPVLCQLISVLFSKRIFLFTRRFYSNAAVGIKRSVERVFFDLSSLFYSAQISLDACVRSLYRSMLSHEKTLEWVTASDAERSKHSFYLCLKKGALGAAVGAVLALFSLSVPAKLVGALWLVYPITSYLTGVILKQKKVALERKDAERIRMWSHDMWNFYAHYVNAQSSYLPPDNLSELPKKAVAMRTSPTNIGFYLIGVLTARDMGFISTKTMYNCVKNTVDTVERLPKWKGHLYNWYELRRPSILGRAYVSTVDSGNFCALLLTLCEGILEYAGEEPLIPELALRIKKLYKDADFSALYDKERDLFRLGYDDTLGVYDKTCYDIFMSEARLTSYFALARGQVPVRHWYSLSRRPVRSGFHIGLASWTGTAFEYMMPALLMPTYENSLAKEAQSHCLVMQKQKRAKGVWGTSESGFYAFDPDLNYQYKAFGVGALALKSDVDTETVISPYSSFLLTKEDPRGAIRNLARQKDLGMYGRFGFYEAMDCTESRVGSGVGKVQSYMAHHVGMSLCACDNLLFSGKMRARFMRDPEMESAKSLLCEKIPADITVSKSKYRTVVPERVKRSSYQEEIKRSSFSDERRVALVSNSLCTLVCDSKGKVHASDGSKALCLTEFDKSYGGGLRVMYKGADGITSPDTASDGSFEHSQSFARYLWEQNGESATLSYTVSSEGSSVLATIDVESDDAPEFAALCFEPVLDTMAKHASHVAYSGLFVESKYDKYNDILVYKRKHRGENSGYTYMAVSCAHGDIIDFGTRKDEILSAGYTREELFSAVDAPQSSKDGVCIMPYCILRSKMQKRGDRKYSACFVISASEDETEAMGRAAAIRDKLFAYGIAPYVSKLSAVTANSFAISGVSSGDVKLLPRLLRAVTKRERGEGSGSAESLWELGISGDYPIVLCRYSKGDKEKIAGLLRLHRLFLIKWLRFNPVILYREEDGYLSSKQSVLQSIARKCGSSLLVGTKTGVFFVNESTASKASIEALHAFACADLDREEKPQEQEIVTVRRGDGRQSNVEGLLNLRGGAFTDEGFSVNKNVSHLPWCHVIASRCFGTVMSQNSLGYSYLFNSQMGRLTEKDSDLIREDSGEKLILKIGKTRYDLAACSHTVHYGFGNAVYEGRVGGVGYRITVGVGAKDFVKRYGIKLESVPDGAFLEFRVRPDASQLCTCERDGELFSFWRKAWFLKRHKGFMFMKDAEYYAINSELVATKKPSSEGETVFLGAYSGEPHRIRMEELCKTDDFPLFSFKKPRILLSTSHTSLDLMANGWLPYQNLVCRMFARSGYYQSSGAYGYRDQLQDAANAADYAPDVLRCHIYRCACHQFEKGDVLHWWHRTENGTFGIRTRCSDDRLWLVYAVCEYIRVTGDESILKTKIPYIDADELSDGENEKMVYVRRTEKREDLFTHCLRALYISMTSGEHGLPLIGSCDWNDSFSEVGTDGKGESVWLAWFMKMLCDSFIPLCIKFGNTEAAGRLKNYADFTVSAAKKHAYEYGQYLRGFYGDGSPLGSKLCEECKSDVLPQAFAILADVEDGKRKEALLDTLESLYDEENGILCLFLPPFSHEGEKYTGYVRDYPAGVRENGGQYTHAAMWAVMALCQGGRYKEAEKILLSLCPAERCIDPAKAIRYGLEPYAVAGDVYSSAELAGRGGWSWYTGAAGWMRTAIMELCKKDT